MIVDQPTPCYRKPDAYDILIDHDRGQSPIWRHALNEAKTMCGQCPVQTRCLTENREEPWVAAMLNTRKAPLNHPTCGTPRGANTHYRHGETACTECRAFEAERSRRRKAAKALAATVHTFADIPEVVRIMHSEHVKLKSRGEDIPDQIRDGERTYQALRHQIRKARKAQDEAA